MKGNDTSASYLTRAQDYVTALANIGQPIPENYVLMLVVVGLRDEYNGVKKASSLDNSQLSFQKFLGVFGTQTSSRCCPTQAFTAATAANSAF